MPIDPKRIVVQVALRTLQLTGTQQAALETSYQNTTLDGADVPLSGLKDAVIAVEAELAHIIANDRTHPYRSLFYGRSDDLPSGARIPSESDEMVRFVGIFSGLVDSVSGRPLTETTIQEMNRFMEGHYQGRTYKYVFSSGRVFHTRSQIYLEGCVWSEAEARTRLFPGLRNSSIPNALEATWVARTIQFLAQEGWLIPEGGYYAQIAESGIAMLRSRNTDAPQLPAVEATANPITN